MTREPIELSGGQLKNHPVKDDLHGLLFFCGYYPGQFQISSFSHFLQQASGEVEPGHSGH